MSQTNMNEQIEVRKDFEERLGIQIEHLNSTYLDESGDTVWAYVNGEVKSVKDPKLPNNIKLVITAYGQDDQIINVDQQIFRSSVFYEFEPFSIQLRLPEVPKRIRVHPNMA